MLSRNSTLHIIMSDVNSIFGLDRAQTKIGGLHCCHVGGQKKRKFIQKVCIKMAVNAQRGKSLSFLSTNMAAVMVCMWRHGGHFGGTSD